MLYTTTTVLRLCQCNTRKPLKDTFEVPPGKAYKTTTTFVRHHPFKPGWEVRKCLACGSQWAVDSSILTT